MTQKTKELLHPIQNVPAVATIVSDWMKNGRFIGLELQFPDGHRCKLTFAEIQAAQAALEEEAVL